MIDLDRMEEQLDRALTERVAPRRRPAQAHTPPPPPAPPLPPPPRPSAASAPSPVLRRRPRSSPRPILRAPHDPRATGPATDVGELLELGLLDEVDARIAATTDRRDALTWATMRALLDGRHDDARSSLVELQALARATDDREAWDRYWAQRLWLAVESGTDAERADVLDHCRARAYRFDDVPWWGNLTLLLALMGKHDEAVRAFDEAAELLARVANKDGRWFDAVTNLVEAASVLGDAARIASLTRSVRWPEGRLVVVGPGAVCKGSVDRYRALAFAATGKWKQAEECFRSAESTHRAIGAGPLLNRTLQQAAGVSVAA